MITLLKLEDSLHRRTALLAVSLVALTTALLVAYFSWSKRSFAIVAQTHEIRIEITASAISSWRFPKAVLCLPDDKTRENGVDTVACGVGFRNIAIEKAQISWPAETVLEIRKMSSSSYLEIKLIKLGTVLPSIEGTRLPMKSRILVSAANWRETGVLPFGGIINLGNEPAPGETGYLVSGRYEIHDSLLFRNSSVLVKEGLMFPGDRVQVIGPNKKPIPVSGFFSAQVNNDDDPGLQLVAYSPAGDNHLRIDRIATVPSSIESSWLDRAIKDPWLLGIAGLLATLLTLIEFTAKLGSWIIRRDGKEISPDPITTPRREEPTKEQGA